jgi:phosphoserine phosphatase RsbU/P
MKFRWKLLILLLVISIIPVVSLRTFGIQNVRLMASALFSQVQAKQIDDARHRLQLVIDDYSKVIRTSREQAEMALFYQTFEVRRILQTELLPHYPDRPSPVSDVCVPIADEIVDLPSKAPLESSKNAAETASYKNDSCFSVPSTADAADVESKIFRLKRMTPVYQAASQYLGNLILRQYFGLKNGVFSVYPCDHENSRTADMYNQVWYRSAFQEKATAWSRPYADPISGQIVMAVSYPVLTEDEHVLGVASLLVPLNSLLDQALQMSELPDGTAPYLCTLAIRPTTGVAGAKILAPAQTSETLQPAPQLQHRSQWLTSSDKAQFRAMLEDIARRQYRIREMPFNGRMSFWAYGPLMHQGSAFVFIVPKDRILNLEDHPVLESIQDRLERVENYTAGFLFFLIIIAAVVALTFSRTVTKPLAQLSAAARKLTAGDFEAGVSISSRDEFGNLGRIFNSIGPQLKEHYRMRRSLEVAEEIQQTLLPGAPPEIPGLDIYGMTLFSDETGGDYFDYLCIDGDKLCVTVGDVAGHGIPAAILMSTVRGFLRLRATMPGTLGDIVADVNREFVKDADDSAQFMTLSLARIDRRENLMYWVRAGHDPAILYDPDNDSFSILDGGNGIPLGISLNAVYTVSFCDVKPGQIIFMGTDGIWEARNAEGELFGKERLQRIIGANSGESARTIALSILDAVEDHRGRKEQEDDSTVVVIKIIDV